MNTKAQPSRFDSLPKLDPDEPYFVLRGQDELAPDLVELWAIRAKSAGCHIDKVNNAHRIAEEMREWPRQKKPD